MNELANRIEPATRAEKQEATRRRLVIAAARQIGLDGYGGASIHKIAAAAEIANGTFYNYFESQQDLFEKLLPEMGEHLVDRIREATKGEASSLRREEIGFRAFFDYLAENPSFYRILNEGEIFAPKAFAGHMRNMAAGYVRALKLAQSKGELIDCEERELEVIAYILLSARNYLAYRYTFQNGKAGRLPDWVVRAYMKFIEGGLSSRPTPSSAVNKPSHRQRPIERMATSFAEAGSVEVTLAVDDACLDDLGQILRSEMTALVEQTGIGAVSSMNTDLDYAMTSLTVNFMRASHDRKLTAKGQCTALSESFAHVQVNVYEATGACDAIASGLVIFTFNRK